MIEDTSGAGTAIVQPDKQLTEYASSRWQNTLERVIRSVVSIHITWVHSFDNQGSNKSEATGFVVDREQGLILTNRHVAGPSPFWGYCTFHNHEECDVEVVWHDPVHDFAFLKYDPAKVRYAEIEALELRPERAKIGAEIRLVGNDSGEVLSIASAVISRLDRNTPQYSGYYQDFNTNYIQASAASKGGSSGSPVVDIDGYAVGLQAGGLSDASVNYFLPLPRIVRALNKLREGKPISRGSLQTVWQLESFDICRRLGLTTDEETKFRNATTKTHSMLKVDMVLPEGPGDGKLRKGDLMLEIDGQTVLTFLRLEEILDDSVGKAIPLKIRRGDKVIDMEVTIEDLYATTPGRFLTAGGATFHDISQVMAKVLGIATRGVYSPDSGLMPLPYTILIDSVDDQPVPDLDTFIEVMKCIKDKDQVKIEYRQVAEIHVKVTTHVSLSTSLYPTLTLWTRDKDYKRWTAQELEYSFGTPAPKPKKGSFPAIDGLENPNAAYISNAIVHIRWNLPFPVSGFKRHRRWGHGLVVDAEQGLVFVSRAIVPFDLGTITVIVGEVEVFGKIVFLHPLYNYAILSYDPSLVEAPVASVKLSTIPAKAYSKVTLVCISDNDSVRMATETTISSITNINISLIQNSPRNRAINVDSISCGSSLANQNELGVMCNADGVVVALLIEFLGDQNNYNLSIHASSVYPVVERLRNGPLGNPRVLDFELVRLTLAAARRYGVEEHWIDRIAAECPRQMTWLLRNPSCPPPEDNIQKEDQLQANDILLSLNGALVTDMSPFAALYDEPSLPATIVRAGKEMNVQVPTVSVANLEPERLVFFQGMYLQKPHLAVRQSVSKMPSEVYINGVSSGSPAGLYDIEAVIFITEVNDVATPDLDAFLEAVQKIPDNTFFRLSAETFAQIPKTYTLKKCNYYVSQSEGSRSIADHLSSFLCRFCSIVRACYRSWRTPLWTKIKTKNSSHQFSCMSDICGKDLQH